MLACCKRQALGLETNSSASFSSILSIPLDVLSFQGHGFLSLGCERVKGNVVPGAEHINGPLLSSSVLTLHPVLPQNTSHLKLGRYHPIKIFVHTPYCQEYRHHCNWE